MPSRRSTDRPTSAAASTAASARTPDGRGAAALWQIVLLAGAAPLTVALLLYHQQVPLGCPGRLVYLYTELWDERLKALGPAAGIATVLALGVGSLASLSRARRYLGAAALTIGMAGVGLWTYLSPPRHLAQHVFNSQSPAHDGAFVREAIDELRFKPARRYLAEFPDRAGTPPQKLRGTRVISNPPATTLLAAAAERLARGFPELGRAIERELDEDTPEWRVFRHDALMGLVFTWMLVALWVLSAPFLYLLGREFFAPAAAAVYAVCALVTPMTLAFSPGKDPAQLLTTAIPVWLWAVACRRGGRTAATASGVAFMLATMVGLVHVWIAVAVGIAGAIAYWRRGLLSALLLAVCGAVAAAIVLYVCTDLNVATVAWAVARSQSEITRGPVAMPLAWQILGIPLFLLLAGPALWMTWLGNAVVQISGLRAGAQALRSAASRRVDATPAGGASNGPGPRCGTNDALADRRFGRWLLLLTAIVLVATVGFTNIETPRLWIPFAPLLLLGGLLQLDAIREFRRAGSPASRKTLVALMLLVWLQITFSAAHWSVMDMRETEYRLATGRFYG
jgi:hypothetical protein